MRGSWSMGPIPKRKKLMHTVEDAPAIQVTRGLSQLSGSQTRVLIGGQHHPPLSPPQVPPVTQFPGCPPVLASFGQDAASQGQSSHPPRLWSSKLHEAHSTAGTCKCLSNEAGIRECHTLSGPWDSFLQPPLLGELQFKMWVLPIQIQDSPRTSVHAKCYLLI